MLRALLAVLALACVPACRLQTQAPPKAVSQSAPTFTLPDHNGQPVELAKLRERGPVVLVFYRGHW
jgi:cytochrome oxidase Cu insertion factor (SCO1/SenC/PrrC family)